MVRSLVVKKFAAALKSEDAQKDDDLLAPGHMVSRSQRKRRQNVDFAAPVQFLQAVITYD